MRCPIDATDLVMSERQGVEIDYCPSCRGVWLDRGELDKILDRAADTAAVRSGGTPPGARSDEHRHDEDRYREDRDGYRGTRREEPYRGDQRRPAKKKESWLGDLLDFG